MTFCFKMLYSKVFVIYEEAIILNGMVDATKYPNYILVKYLIFFILSVFCTTAGVPAASPAPAAAAAAPPGTETSPVLPCSPSRSFCFYGTLHITFYSSSIISSYLLKAMLMSGSVHMISSVSVLRRWLSLETDLLL